MDRRQLLQRAAATPFALYLATVEAHAMDQFDSVITNGASGLLIIMNGPEDYSLKIISGDGTKNVTVVRYAGRTAEADARLVHDCLLPLLRLVRLDV